MTAHPRFLSTQEEHPWRAVIRTAFALVVALATMAPLVYEAAAQHDPATATGWAGTALAIAAGITRVLALPQVNAALARFVPWLAAAPRGE